MAKKEIFQLVQFDKSVDDFYVYYQSESFDSVVKEALEFISSEVDRYNDAKSRTMGDEFDRLEYVSLDKLYEIFENGQNWIVNNRVYGIVSLEIEDNSIEYEDVILLVDNIDLDENDVKAMQMPFDDLVFFKGYMKRVIEVFDGEYDVLSPEDFDKEINDGSSKVFAEFSTDRPFVIHTKLPKGSYNKILIDKVKENK